jgi:DNA-binding CsgD family transcriptional regulator
MDLLERDASLAQLEAALTTATAGPGRLALVSGEAGIGKTALVQRFARVNRASVRVLWGACDALFTPRPLSPLHDIAAQTGGELVLRLASSSEPNTVLNATLAELQRRPTLAVFEDVHWADEATLDLLRFLGRRLARTQALLVLTYRDDELGPTHALRSVLGDLVSSAAAVRIDLAPLSERAVGVLVGNRNIDAAALHRQTGGNPFFVSEVLSSPRAGLPLTVRDAVLGRVARLSSAAHEVLEAAAIVGPRIERWLLEAMLPDAARAADECLGGGVLVAQRDGLAFRHELAREAVLETIPPLRRVRLHRLALDGLRTAKGKDVALTRFVHHADGCQAHASVIAYAGAAAQQAAAASAHRAAANLYALALQHADHLPAAERAALLSAHAWECHLTADLDTSIASRRQAIDFWREAGDSLREGENLTSLAGAFVAAGRWSEVRAANAAAIELLQSLPPGPELARAYRTHAYVNLANHDLTDAIAQAERAVAIAEVSHDAAAQAVAHDTLGAAWIHRDRQRGLHHLERARAIAHNAGLDADVARSYANLGSSLVQLFDLDQAEHYLIEGLAYASERDLDTYWRYMLGWMAVTHVHRGRWAQAESAAREVLRAPASNAHFAALLALGRLEARRGGRGTAEVLNQALNFTRSPRQFLRRVQACAVRAEAAWLAGDTPRALAEAEAVYAEAVQKQYSWGASELAFWRWRVQAEQTGAVPAPDWIAAPFAAQIAGDWRAAADEWGRLGCPYEQARALADGDLVAQEQALLIYDELGARPAAAALRRQMRARGIVRLPRGPRPATRANRFGLTSRQLEILQLLAEDLSNSEIAGRLSITPKTAENHVSAVLAKLDVGSRKAAVRLACGHHLLVSQQ